MNIELKTKLSTPEDHIIIFRSKRRLILFIYFRTSKVHSILKNKLTNGMKNLEYF